MTDQLDAVMLSILGALGARLIAGILIGFTTGKILG